MSRSNNWDIQWGSFYGAAVSLALWILVTAFLLISFDANYRALVALTIGTAFWVIAWIIGGVIIALPNVITMKLNLVGFLCGALMGIIMGGILVSWPYCSQPFDPTPQFIVYSVGLPVILFHNLLFGLFNLASINSLGVVSSVLLWGLMGMAIAELIRRHRTRTKQRFA